MSIWYHFMDYDGIYILGAPSKFSGRTRLLKGPNNCSQPKIKLEKQNQKQRQSGDLFLLLSTGFLHSDNPFFWLPSPVSLGPSLLCSKLALLGTQREAETAFAFRTVHIGKRRQESGGGGEACPTC